jgi:hypothetical protein
MRDSLLTAKRHIASEAGRIMAIEGVRDFGLAKQKAAARLGYGADAPLPRNADVNEALREYQRVFQSTHQPLVLENKRRAAVAAMIFFEKFQPRLVGQVLDGTADSRSPIELHVFADAPEEVDWFLEEQAITSQVLDRRIRLNRSEQIVCGTRSFLAEENRIELTILPLNMIRQAPIGPIDSRPMARASIGAAKKLLTTSS